MAKDKEAVYEQLTANILERMKAGAIPWRRPWKLLKVNGMTPRNIRGRAYRGYNWFFLTMLGFDEPIFLTYNQAKAMGGNVIKGEHGFPVVFWNVYEKEVDGEIEKIPVMRLYTVFNVSQCENLNRKVTPQEPEVEFDSIEIAEEIWENMPKRPALRYGGNRATYSVSQDLIQMPKRSSFEEATGFYETFFHEIGHSTGHPSRLNRKELGQYGGGQDYSLEELTAELTAAFLCAEAGIDASTLDNQASYLRHWMKALQDDPKMFVTAAGKAQKAADYVLNTTFEEEAE